MLEPSSYHDAVMALDWNGSHRNMSASGFADSTVRAWDITTHERLNTMSHHSGKVKSVRWYLAESPVLASSGV